MKDFLKETPIFPVLSEEERTVMMDIIEEKRFSEDSIILYKGQISDELYVIRSG